MYFLQQLAALIPEDAPHEYASRPALVEFTVDASGFRLVGGELPLD
jgi:hypothetical protein